MGARRIPPMSGRVALTERGIEIDGRARLLYGGEVQYYRIRDKAGDVAKTHALWAEALDQLLAAFVAQKAAGESDQRVVATRRGRAPRLRRPAHSSPPW